MEAFARLLQDCNTKRLKPHKKWRISAVFAGKGPDLRQKFYTMEPEKELTSPAIAS
jgi:hypothetical protein